MNYVGSSLMLTQLEEIEHYTQKWLNQPEIQAKMLEIARNIVREKFGWVDQAEQNPEAQAQQEPQLQQSLQEAESAAGTGRRT
jgi:hypothetical protein